MTEPLWIGAGYVVGAVPSAALIARARDARPVLELARRDAGERDAHLLLRAHLGPWWAVAAASVDVLKASGIVLAARAWGGLPSRWLAAVGAAVVAGYCWPPVERSLAGRGLAAAAGVSLVLLPVPMIVMGLLIVGGAVLGDTALPSTIGLASLPVTAALLGATPALVLMAVAIGVLVLLRRLEGVHRVAAAGVRWPRAVLYRALFDSSGPPGARVLPDPPSPNAVADRETS